MIIRVLMENTAQSPDLIAEHGLSLYIETGEHRILFDMGQSGIFMRNAERRGIDLTKVEFAVISHGHYDHGGALEKFFSVNSTAKVYIQRGAFLPHFRVMNGEWKYNGIDRAFADHPQVVLLDGDAVIDE